MKGKYFLILALIFPVLFIQDLCAQNDYEVSKFPVDTICSHKAINDKTGKILSWYKPNVPGAGYSHVMKLAADFIKNCPVEPTTKLKLYMVHADFDGPRQNKNFYEGKSGTDWMPNPACTFAGFVQSLAVDYYMYSGDASVLKVVRECLDQMLSNGTTPDGWLWAKCPYASADPRSLIYSGATKWENEGRGDGFHFIEPDKVGELGFAYLQFYEITGEQKYLDASVNCADALAKNVRNVSASSKKFSADFSFSSPWPFRINAETGKIKDDYCSNVVDPVKLFDELIRIGERIKLPKEKIDAYKSAGTLAWNWLFAKNGPMKTFVWNGYFEDVLSDPNRINRVEITPVETARYILKHAEKDSHWKTDVPALLNWVKSAFKVDGVDAIREQTWCYEPMGSHTARYASVCALWHQKTGDENYKNEAFRFFNFATYMCEDNGYVWTGPDWPTSWFTDGYGDYIQHFMEGLAAVPEWAPADENHLLASTSVVKNIQYSHKEIRYSTFDNSSVETFRVKSKPLSVKINDFQIKEVKKPNQEGYTWKKFKSGGVLSINHKNGNEVIINF